VVVHDCADLQSLHGFRCYDNTHVRKLIPLYTANAYSVEREMSASACTRSDCTRSEAGLELAAKSEDRLSACGQCFVLPSVL